MPSNGRWELIRRLKVNFFLAEPECVYCTVRVESVYMIHDNFSIKDLIKCQTSCLTAYTKGDILFFIAVRVISNDCSSPKCPDRF